MVYYIVSGLLLMFFWCPCMAINVNVQYNGGFLPDIILWTQCYLHRGTCLNAMKRFCICSLLIPPKRFDTFSNITGGLRVLTRFPFLCRRRCPCSDVKGHGLRPDSKVSTQKLVLFCEHHQNCNRGTDSREATVGLNSCASLTRDCLHRCGELEILLRLMSNVVELHNVRED